jgi:hypothetical protein
LELLKPNLLDIRVCSPDYLDVGFTKGVKPGVFGEGRIVFV